MSRDFEVQPCEGQKKMLEGLGFKHLGHHERHDMVLWYGHGLKMVLEKDKVPDPSLLMAKIVGLAKGAGKREVQNAMLVALGSRPHPEPEPL
jgi:hypothetical protein